MLIILFTEYSELTQTEMVPLLPKNFVLPLVLNITFIPTLDFFI